MNITSEYADLTNPTKHLFHIPQYTIQNRNWHISAPNGELWDMEQVHCGICESGQLTTETPDHDKTLSGNLDVLQYIGSW